MVEIQEYAKNDDGENDEPLEHVAQHNKYYRDDQEHHPTDMDRN